jgi:hypothetical protein
MTATKEANRKIISEALLDDLSGRSKTGMRPFTKEDKIRFLQTWGLIIVKR